MTFGALVRTLLRRWYLTLPLVALVLYASATVPSRLPVQYRANAAVVLVGPEIVEVRPLAPPGARNRLLHLGESLETVSQIVTLTLDTNGARQSLARQGLLDDYVVSTGEDTTIIEFHAAGPDPAQVEETMEALLTTVDTELEATQDELGVPTDDRLLVRHISSGNTPAPGIQSDKRSLIMLLAAGGIGVIGAVVTADVGLRALADARSRRRAARTSDEPPQPGPAQPDPSPDGPARADRPAAAAAEQPRSPVGAQV